MIRVQQFPETTFTALLSFVSAGEAIDLTSATLQAFLKRSLFDADADALATPSLVVSNVDTMALLTIAPADISEIDPFLPCFWQCRATVGAIVYQGDANCGPLNLRPNGMLAADYNDPPSAGISATLEPASGTTAVIPSAQTGVTYAAFTDDATIEALTTASYSAAAVTAGIFFTGTYNGALKILQLIAGTQTTGGGYWRPNDYNASTNQRVLVALT